MRWTRRPRVQWFRPKAVTRGTCCRKYLVHAFIHIRFCICDTGLLVKSVYVRVLKEGESRFRVVAFFFY